MPKKTKQRSRPGREASIAKARLMVEMKKVKALEAALVDKETSFIALFKEHKLMQVHSRHLTRQVLLAQEEERKQISRELHDEIAQVLTSINVRLSELKSEGSRNGRELIKKIADTQHLVTKSVEIVHRFARELRPALLDNLGLNPALRAFVQSFIKRWEVSVNFTTVPIVEQLSNRKRTVLYRVAQEALTNVARHAHATRVVLSIREVSGYIVMQIRDNGNAFDVDEIFSSRKTKRLGLIGMRERLEMVGGFFEVKSVPGEGTLVHARISLPGTQSKSVLSKL